jgi:hypothetical protein
MRLEQIPQYVPRQDLRERRVALCAVDARLLRPIVASDLS